MKRMIAEYIRSLELIRKRSSELCDLRRSLISSGDEIKVQELDLDRRISTLNTECIQTKEVINHLTSYARRIEQRVET